MEKVCLSVTYLATIDAQSSISSRLIPCTVVVKWWTLPLAPRAAALEPLVVAFPLVGSEGALSLPIAF
jgi:hypothetical protein